MTYYNALAILKEKRVCKGEWALTVSCWRASKMLRCVSLLVTALLALGGVEAVQPERIVCYYNSTARLREGKGKLVIPTDLDPALSTCTHLVYGYAELESETYKLVPHDAFQELDTGKKDYRSMTDLKRRFPSLRVMLSVGGGADVNSENYLVMLENEEHRKAFISSARALLRQYNFDGLDLAWQFPEIRVKKDRGTLGSFWHGLKKKVGLGHNHDDEKEEEHRKGFTALVKDLHKDLRTDGLLLSVSLLPNVNTAAYFEVKELMPHVDHVNIMAFGFKTSIRNKKEADYPAPLYSAGGREVNQTVDGIVRYWLEQGAQANKLILGIPTYGVTWKLTEESKVSGAPPIEADGPGAAGPETNMSGRLSYAEVCQIMVKPEQKASSAPHLLRRVTDPSHKLGTYAFRLAPSSSEESSEEPAAKGIWVGFEEPDSAAYKGAYVKNKGLGGIAIVDLTTDDFKGSCNGEKYPILKAARNHL